MLLKHDELNPGQQQPSSDGEPEQELDTRRGPRILCAACGAFLTYASQAISMQGNHQHTFLNPAGFVYKIRCVGEVPGGVPQGPSSDHWSWFPGYRWQLIHCRSCGVHLGWLFRSTDHTFSGLVVERIVETEEQEDDGN
jgi:hypothetical protein